ncbi:aminoacyl-tRNA hydrolase [Chloroflexota bacterium]
MRLIVGLGNPGREYAGNRHNIGFMCVSKLGKLLKISFNRKQCLARIGTGYSGSIPVVLARPQTFMNNSGESVARLCHRYGVKPEDVIVIHDEIDLPLATLRIRRGGGSGGNKGIASIIDHLGTRDFIRVRVGIGRPPGTEDARPDKDSRVIRFVLSNFSPSEQAVISEAIPQACRAAISIITDGLESAMNEYN